MKQTSPIKLLTLLVLFSSPVYAARIGGGGSSSSPAGGMTPGASYYVQVDPPSVQAGAFNIASGTVLGPLTANDAAVVYGVTGSTEVLTNSAGTVTIAPDASGDEAIIIDDSGSPGGGIQYKSNGTVVGNWLNAASSFDLKVSSGNGLVASGRISLPKNAQKVRIMKADNSTVVVEFDALNNSSFTTPVVMTSSANVTGQIQVNTIKFNDGTTQTTAATGGGGGGTTVWSKLDGANLDTAVSTINVQIAGGLTATSSPSGQINIGLSAQSTYYLGLGVAATTYATQVDVNKSTTSTSLTFANYYSTGATQNLFNLKTVDATTYALQSVVLQSTNQINFQFSNYATTQTTTNINNTFNNYNSTGANNALFLPIAVANTTYMKLGTPPIVSVATGSAMGFNGTISSPTATILISTAHFTAQLQGGNTTFIQANGSSVTLQGQFLAGSNVTLTPNGNGTTTIATTGGGGSGTTIMFREEGSDVVASSTLNVVGTNSTVTSVGGVATLTISGGGSSTVNLTSYTTAGTFYYTVPTTNASLHIWLCGGGGSGGAGAGAAQAAARGGGSGGGGGACMEVMLSTSSVGATLGVTVGTGTLGGVGVAANNGGNGTAGGTTSLFDASGSTIAAVFGGGAGRGSQNNAGGGGSGGGSCGAGATGGTSTLLGGCPATAVNIAGTGMQGAGSTVGVVGKTSEFGGASGGAGAATTAGFAGGSSARGGAGGGGGAGITAATPGVSGSSAAGGKSGDLVNGTSGNGGSAGSTGSPAGAGGKGRDGAFGHGGDGGGSGGADNAANAPAGGDGGYCGGGGGAGSGGTNTGGNGGNGGPGCVIIIPD